MAQPMRIISTLQKASISNMRFKFSIDKEVRIFAPGDVITGTLTIFEIPGNMEGVSSKQLS